MREGVEVQGPTDHGSESVRTRAIGCPGCGQLFTPKRPNQRHCRAACRKLAERKAAAARQATILERLDPGDPGRAE